MPNAAVTTTVLSGLRTNTTPYFAQVKNTVVITNGIDDNRIYDVYRNDAKTLGLAWPAAAPTGGTSGTGLTGAYRYRVKWYDRNTDTYSVSSSELSVTLTNQGYQLTQPSSPPSRTTHWIVERTTAGGAKFFPVNRTVSAPYGTAIATTTYTDTTTDSTLRQRTIIPNTQGIPGPYRFCFAHKNRVFMLGAPVINTTTTDLTSGSAAVTSTSEFQANMAGMLLMRIGNTGAGSGKMYRIDSYTDASNITLAETVNAADAGVNVECLITGARNKLVWSEASYPEHYGTVEVGGLSNEVILGNRGDVLTSGVSMGDNGILLSTDKGLYYFTYTEDPNPIRGDGRFYPLATLRHAASPKCLKYIEGYVYGMDAQGMWRMRPNGTPEDISEPLQYDFKRMAFSCCNPDYWHIQYDDHKHWVKFYISESGDTVPTLAYVWDTIAERWVSTKRYYLGITSGTEVKDRRGHLRNLIVQQAPSTTSNIGSVFWTDDLSTGYGIPSGESALTGTATAGTTTTLTNSGANWTANAFIGCPITVNIDGTEETRVVRSNTATEITVDSNFTGTPDAGDTYKIGPIPAQVRTARMDAGMPQRKKKWIMAYIPFKYKSSSVNVSVRAYHDQSATSDSDQVFTSANDGVTLTTSDADRIIDPTVNEQVYQLPLNGVWSNSLTLVFYSSDPGIPWDLNGPITVEYETDGAFQPATKE